MSTPQAGSWLLLNVGLLVVPAAQSQNLGLQEILAQPILAPNQPAVEVKTYAASRVPALRIPETRRDWEKFARETRKRVLEEVIFRGEAQAWRDANTKVEWLETIHGGPGYQPRPRTQLRAGQSRSVLSHAARLFLRWEPRVLRRGD